MRFELGEHAPAVAALLDRWERESRLRRLFERDAAIFSNADEARWLGWLELPAAPVEEAIGPHALQMAIAAHPADTAVVLGMGGSSLWPAVLGRTWNDRAASTGRRRALHVLDTTVPDAVESFLDSIALERALFFVSSKSGSTIEPNALFELIHARLAAQVGPNAAGRHFVAITDPGSALEARARKSGFLGTALGRPDVGGRFSALSPFGMLPALAMGLEPERLLERARKMAAACAPTMASEQNPGLRLGLALGALAQAGRDKLTLSLSPAIASFGGWIEQLVAESTGKSGKGLLPITDEGLGDPGRYAKDRIFVDVAVAGDATTAARHARLAALARAGHPTIRIELADAFDLGGAVFQWELATAVVGSVLGVNPFDQPDVEAAKQATRELMAASGRSGGRPETGADLESDGIRIFAGTSLAAAARDANGDPTQLLKSLAASLQAGDAFLLNAFLAESPEIRAKLEGIRRKVGESRRVATVLSFGPRYLHSSGQLQKGGPNRLAGLQLWQSASARKGPRLAIPEIGGDFDALAEAQAVGDFRVLSERGRRMLGIDLGSDPLTSLDTLAHWIEGALI